MAENEFLWKSFLLVNILAFTFSTNQNIEKYCMKGSDLEGKVYIEYGNSFDIDCTLDDEKQLALSENSIPKLYFIQNDTRIANEKVETINSSTIRLHIQEPLQSISSYMCKMEGNPNSLCSNTIVVGSRPSLVEDLKCIGYNYESFTCTWTPADSSTDINYDLKYYFSAARGRLKIPRNCPYKIPHSNGERKSCTWKVTTFPEYKQSHNGMFYFVLEMKNSFGTTVVKKDIFHFAHVLPNPPDGLVCVNKTSESIYLRWSIPRAMQVFQSGLQHRIIYRSEYEQNWQIVGNLSSLQDMSHVYFNLTSLQHAYARYDIRVSMRSAVANQDDHTMWSKNSSITVRTMGKIPASPPLTNIGSFEIVPLSDNSANLYVYWQTIQDRIKNGGNFEYHIEVEGESSIILPVNITDSYAAYENLNLVSNSYTFNIWSKNELGKSENKSVVNVPRLGEDFNDAGANEPEFFRKIEYGSGYYELFWETPSTTDSKDIKSYTIFWCTYDKDRPYQCAGYLDWEEIPGDQTYYNTTLIVPEEKINQFAISANSDTSSSGMVWACTIIYGRVLAKLEDVWVRTINSTAIRMNWGFDCSDGIESVESYIIHYCDIPNDGSTSCAEPDQEFLIYGDSKTRSVDVSGLKPYQRYKVAISVVNRNNKKSLRSDYKIITTLDDAPQPPGNLSIIDLTNSTISIKYEQPSITNGELNNYKIKSTNTATDVTTEYFIDSEEYTVTNLQSYVTYNISVQACTSKCSRPSDTLSVRTQGGYPSKLLQPISPFKNNTDLIVEWKPPEEPNGNVDVYEVKLERDGNVLMFNVTDTEYVIKDCGTEYGTFTILVRAINVFPEGVFYGPWSDELVLSCETSSNLWLWTLTPVVFLIVLFLVYQLRRLHLRCKKMQNVEIKLPPGIATILEVEVNDVKPQNENKRRPEEGNSYEMEKLLNHKTSNEILKENKSPSDADTKQIQSLLSNKVQKTSPYVSLQEFQLKPNDTIDLPASSSKPTSSTPSNYCVLGVDAVPHRTINPNYISADVLQLHLAKSKSDLPQVPVLSSGYVQAGDLSKISNPNS